MQTRAKIIVKGEVQKVGYRDAVEKIARKSNIKGFLQNLKPYDVIIVCEGEEGDIKRFIGALKIEGDPLISVSDIAIEYEGQKGEYKYFEIKRGSREDEDAERWDEAAGYLRTLIREMSTMHSDLKEDTRYIPGIKEDTSKMLEKQDNTIEVLEDIKGDTGEITNALTFLKEIHRETSELREKYELLSRDVDEIKVKLKVG